MSKNLRKHIPVYQPYLEGNEMKYVSSCLDSGWISSKGEFVVEFEKMFAKFLGVGGASSVCNGTVALHLALYLLGIKKGDEVIVPTLTYVASVNAIRYVGATPVFVDCEADSWNIDVSKVEKKITSRTKAILAVHLYGAMCDISSLQRVCKSNELLLIEDAAEAFGSKWNNQFAGSFGDIAIFSFFGNKTITTGEGGMLVSNNHELIDRANYLKNQAVSVTREYWYEEIGFNYRMTNVSAAIGLAQLENACKILEKKRLISSWYLDGLKELPLIFQVEKINTVHSYWMFSILFKDNSTREHVRNMLSEMRIETRPLFIPVHKMPVHETTDKFQVSENLSGRGVNLPSSPMLSSEDVNYICNAIKKSIKIKEFKL